MQTPQGEVRGESLASYRIDVTARVWPFLVPAAVFIFLGSLGVCAAFVTHGPIAAHAETIALGGAACMLAGLLLGAFVARPILTHDEYVVAMTRGVLTRVDGAERFVPWEAIAAVRWDAALGALVLAGEGAPDFVIVRTFGRATGPEVAARFEDLRRKELFHLL